ncbi:MAG: hypothetical protein FWH08_02415 [Oscillospiraceae bacterium]|nr:hypothetical protein [Oscillospiraceae bacterium]
MKFKVPETVRVTALKKITSKAGNELTFVTFANKSTFEVLEVKLTLAEGQNAAAIVEGRDYAAIVDFDGNYGSVTLTPAVTKTAATTPAAR